MTIQFNINDEFAFRLTEYGKSLLKPGFAKPDSNGVYIEQLWVVMNNFNGDRFWNGSGQIIEGNLLWVPTELDHINAKIALIQRTGVNS